MSNINVIHMAGYNDICNWFGYAQNKGYTHLMIVRHDKNYDFPIWVSPKDDALEMYNDICKDFSLEVLDVYDISMDFADQFREYHCFNF